MGATLSYGDVSDYLASHFGFSIAPSLVTEGYDQLRKGAGVLVHQGRHCVGVVRRPESDVVDIIDTVGNAPCAVAQGDVFDAMTGGPGKLTAQFFVCVPHSNAPLVYEDWQKMASALRASGGGEKDEMSSTDGAESADGTDDEKTPDPSDDLLSSLRRERSAFLRELRRKCGKRRQEQGRARRLCPGRVFAENRRLVTHVEVQHSKGAVSLSSKQLRLRQSLYNTDQLKAAADKIFSSGVEPFGDRYLERSAELLRDWVGGSPSFGLLRNGSSSGDKFLALVLTDVGPAFLLKADLGQAYRRCGNVYYAGPFADLVLTISLSPETKGSQRRLCNALAQHFMAAGCEAVFLLPRPERVLRGIQEAVLGGVEAQRIATRC